MASDMASDMAADMAAAGIRISLAMITEELRATVHTEVLFGSSNHVPQRHRR